MSGSLEFWNTLEQAQERHEQLLNNSIRLVLQKLATQVSAAGCFQVWLLCEALLSFLLVFCLGQRLAGKKRLLRITSPCHTAVQWAEPGATMCHGSTSTAFRVVFLCATFSSLTFFLTCQALHGNSCKLNIRSFRMAIATRPELLLISIGFMMIDDD
jgi:hypothetical protein